MQDVKERVALTSIFASGGLTLAKGVVGIMTGSLAILTEAAHSLRRTLSFVAPDAKRTQITVQRVTCSVAMTSRAESRRRAIQNR
jgi:hypothetical protein